jgi:TIR domain-containing protein
MAGKIFINYRRDDSIGMAGRLHDRLSQTFGHDNLFIDVDNIPVGADFVAHLNSQVAGCNVLLVVIGPNWLNAKDESGRRRLDDPDDFVAIEIAAALTRDIRVIPVLVDGARMPKASELPDSLKPLARRQAAEVRHAHFGQDAEALVARMCEALGGGSVGLRPWRKTAVAGAAAVAVMLLVGWIGSSWMSAPRPAEGTRLVADTIATVTAKAQADDAEQQRLAALKAEQQRQAKVAADAEAKRNEEQRLATLRADEAEQQRLAALKAEQQRQAKVAADAEAKRNEEQRLAILRAEEDRRAKVGPEANPTTVTKRIKREVSLGYLNLRSGPGQDQKVLVRIPAGSTGVVMRGRCVAPKDNTSSYQFCLVEWNGYEGWVSSNGLE